MNRRAAPARRPSELGIHDGENCSNETNAAQRTRRFHEALIPLRTSPADQAALQFPVQRPYLVSRMGLLRNSQALPASLLKSAFTAKTWSPFRSSEPGVNSLNGQAQEHAADQPRLSQSRFAEEESGGVGDETCALEPADPVRADRGLCFFVAAQGGRRSWARTRRRRTATARRPGPWFPVLRHGRDNCARPPPPARPATGTRPGLTTPSRIGTSPPIILGDASALILFLAIGTALRPVNGKSRIRPPVI
jgi:hypothetical protein